MKLSSADAFDLDKTKILKSDYKEEQIANLCYPNIIQSCTLCIDVNTWKIDVIESLGCSQKCLKLITIEITNCSL